MPRSIWKIDRFDGGLSNHSDPRDILDHELSTASDVMCDVYGKIRMMGSFANVTSPDWNTIVVADSTLSNYRKGYGLYMFYADRDEANAAGGMAYFVFGGHTISDATRVAIYEYDGTATAVTPIEIEAAATAALPMLNYYAANGALRICDGNFANSPTNYWYGYIGRTHFSGTSEVANYADWYALANTLAAPTRGLCAEDLQGVADAASDNVTIVDAEATYGSEMQTEINDGETDSENYIGVDGTDNEAREITNAADANTLTTAPALTGDWDADAYYIYPFAGLGFNVDLTVTGSAGSWTAGTYYFAQSFIYDDNQESKLYEYPDSLSVTADDQIGLRIFCTSPFGARISGGRIYIRESNNNNWYLILDISLESGIRKSLSDVEYSAWGIETATGSGVGTNVYCNTAILYHSIEPTIDTYLSLTGITDISKDITCLYKTAVVANRIAYVGNVEIDSKVYEDSIFKSFPNRFDTFTADRRLDIAVGDGEQVIKLETYADRLLEFKEDTLYIINISQEVEFVEDVYRFHGVKFPYQTCVTAYGIAWGNERGCYLYDGKQVHDLLLKDGLRKIGISYWSTFWTANGSVIYDDNYKQLMALSNLSGAGIDVLIYDFVTGSWNLGTDKLGAASDNYTNPITDNEGNIIIFTDNDYELEEWSNAAASSTNMGIRTKDIDFKYPGLKKNVNMVRISYKSAAASYITVRYRVNGGTTNYDFTPVSGATTVSTVAELNYSGNGWATAVLIPDTLSEASDIYSFKLQFATRAASTVTSAFEVNDISVIYRLKGMR